MKSIQRLELIVCTCFAGAFLAFIYFYATRPIFDPDFWWHLKAGETMIKARGLLQFDPFTFTGDGVVSTREALILKGYWLWQLTAYGLYTLLDFNGIFLLNLFTVGALTGVVVWQMRKERSGYAVIALLMTLAFCLINNTYPLERPQVASFFLAAILLALLTRVRDGGRLGWALPLVMIFWANLHGGFVVGDIILLIFGAGAIIEYRRDPSRLRHIFLWVAVAIGASLLNPNGAMVFGELFNFNNSAWMTGISEYQSTWVKFQNGFWFVAILWVLIALYFLGIWSARQLFWPEFLVALFLAYFSASYMRNVGFFAIAMLPATVFYLQQGTRRKQWQLPSSLSVTLVLLCTTFLVWTSYNLWQGQKGQGPVKAIYPEKAISFLHKSGLQGRMFNSYEYGGYLLWRLAPEIKVFIDGRGVETKVFEDWQKLSSASRTVIDGRFENEVLLEKYKIDYIIQPIYDGDGRIQPLMRSTLNKQDWVPIYLDPTVYILAKINRINEQTINNYRIEKEEFKNRLLLIYNYICQSYPGEVGYQIARAGMLLYLSRYDEALAQIEAIAAIAPNDPALPGLQRELAVLGAKR